jgi:Tol biopolymer transport system component
MARHMTWLFRDGRPAKQIGDPGNLIDGRISPDQHRIVFIRADSGPDIWLADLDRGSSARLTSSDGTAASPVFSPDGASIAYASVRPEASKVLIRSSNLAGGTETVFESTTRDLQRRWAPLQAWSAGWSRRTTTQSQK